MLTKYFTAKIKTVGEMKDFRHMEGWDRLKKTASTYPTVASAITPVMRAIEVDPSRYLYVVNHSVSAYEYFGPNDNFDAFPDAELRERHHTFIGKPVTVDHVSYLVVGTVMDSIYVEPTDPKNPLTGHYVQNVLAVDKKKAEMVDPNLVEGIINGTITDTSMGALARYSECSVCKHVAYTEHEYCTHIASMKGQVIRTASGEERKVFEICHDFEFFEDSIIRPLHQGGLAGGRGADPKAKILMMTASSVFTAEKPAFNVNTDKLKQGPQTNDHEIPDTDEILKEIERINQAEKPSPPEPETIEEHKDTTTYDVEDVKEEIENVRTNRIDEREFEIVVVPGNLMSGFPPDDMSEELKDFLKRLVKKTSSTDPVPPDFITAFNRIRELISLGVPSDIAIHIAWDEYSSGDSFPSSDNPMVIEAIKSVCGQSAVIEKRPDGLIVYVTDMSYPNCTEENLRKLLKVPVSVFLNTGVPTKGEERDEQ